MRVDGFDTVTSVVFLGGGEGMEVDWLDTDISVVFLGEWGLTGLTQSLQSLIWGYGG